MREKKKKIGEIQKNPLQTDGNTIKYKIKKIEFLFSQNRRDER